MSQKTGNQPKTSQRHRVLNQVTASYNKQGSQLADEDPISRGAAFDHINAIASNERLSDPSATHLTSKSKSLLGSNKQQKDL